MRLVVLGKIAVKIEGKVAGLSRPVDLFDGDPFVPIRRVDLGVILTEVPQDVTASLSCKACLKDDLIHGKDIIGLENAKQYMEEHPEIMEALEAMIRHSGEEAEAPLDGKNDDAPVAVGQAVE